MEGFRVCICIVFFKVGFFCFLGFICFGNILLELVLFCMEFIFCGVRIFKS